jgi:hypothetical protein
MNPKLILAVALALLLLVSAPAHGQAVPTRTPMPTPTSTAPAPTPTSTPTSTAPAPTPTSTPAPEATTTPAPPSNQPPVAKIATGCVPGGVCSGLFAREEQPHTVDGTPSHDPDGTIVRYEWTVEQTTLEAGPTLTHTFTPHQLVDDRKRTVRLKVTDDKGASAETSITLRLLEPACEAAVQLGRLRATGICLRHRKQHWTSKDPVTVNGMTLTPAAGRTVTIAKDRISSTGARASPSVPRALR